MRNREGARRLTAVSEKEREIERERGRLKRKYDGRG
jgi:hypothetical protein